MLRFYLFLVIFTIPEAEMGRKKWGLIRAAINNNLTTDSSQDLPVSVDGDAALLL